MDSHEIFLNAGYFLIGLGVLFTCMRIAWLIHLLCAFHDTSMFMFIFSQVTLRIVYPGIIVMCVGTALLVI